MQQLGYGGKKNPCQKGGPCKKHEIQQPTITAETKNQDQTERKPKPKPSQNQTKTLARLKGLSRGAQVTKPLRSPPTKNRYSGEGGP